MKYRMYVDDAIWQKSKIAPVLKTFGADVKEARKAKNLARKDLAEKVNIDTRYLANIENEGTIPSLPVIIQLVKNLRPVDGEIFQSRGHARGKRAAPAGRTEVETLPGTVFAYRGRRH